MSLSEEERRILREMEQTLREHDRAFAERISRTHFLSSWKNPRWAVLAFIGGFSLMLVTFTFSTLIGALGFVVMLLSSIVLLQHVHQRGAGKGRVTDSPGTPDA